jgi:flagellar hook-basal body complex protein FliE
VADPILPISAASIRPIEPVTTDRAAPGAFADTLKSVLGEVGRTQSEAETATQDFVAGRTTDVASTMIAVERAAITLQLMLQIRARALEAYQEVQRIQA